MFLHRYAVDFFARVILIDHLARQCIGPASSFAVKVQLHWKSS